MKSTAQSSDEWSDVLLNGLEVRLVLLTRRDIEQKSHLPMWCRLICALTEITDTRRTPLHQLKKGGIRNRILEQQTDSDSFVLRAGSRLMP